MVELMKWRAKIKYGRRHGGIIFNIAIKMTLDLSIIL